MNTTVEAIRSRLARVMQRAAALTAERAAFEARAPGDAAAQARRSQIDAELAELEEKRRALERTLDQLLSRGLPIIE